MNNLLQRKTTNFRKVTAVLSIMLVTIIAQFNQKAQAQCVDHPLIIPEDYFDNSEPQFGNFSLVVFGNLLVIEGGDIDGRVLVGENFTFNGNETALRIGEQLLPSYEFDNFIVNGNYSSTSPNIYVKGNFKYGTNLADYLPQHNIGEGINDQLTGPPVDFAGLLQYYRDQSDDLATQPGVGTSNFDILTGTLTLTGTNVIDDYVFHVNTGGVPIVNIDFVDIPFDSKIVINIMGTINTFNNVSFPAAYANNLLLNFPESTILYFSENSVVSGSILAPRANVNVDDDSSITGKIVVGGNLNQMGLTNLSDDCLPQITLPVSLVRFDPVMEGNSAYLRWSTSQEVNFAQFEVHQSANGTTWKRIGEVKARGSQETGSNYTFAVTSLSAGKYFRLKMIDLDNTFSFSNVVSFATPNLPLNVYPNPVSEKINFDGGDGVVKIVSSLGQIVFDGNLVRNKREIQVGHLPAGIYFITIDQPDGTRYTQRFIKH